MCLDKRFQLGLPMCRADPHNLQAGRIQTRNEGLVRVMNERHATSHAGTKIVTNLTENDHPAAGHIFTRIGAGPLDNSGSARIPDTKPFTGLPGGEQPARGCAIKNRVADDGVLMRHEACRGRRADDDRATGQPLADIVIRIANHLKLQPLCGKGAKRLTGGAAKPDRDMILAKAGHAELADNMR